MAQVTHVRAVFNYTYEYEGSKISFKKDDEFQLLAKSNTDWWHVRRWNMEGLAQDIYVPAVYVKEVKTVKKESPNPTYENLADLQRKILQSKEKAGTNGNGATAEKGAQKDQPTILAKPKRNSSKKMRGGSGNGSTSPPAVNHQPLQRNISQESDSDASTKPNGISTGDGIPASLLQRLNQRQAVSKKDSVQLGPETSPKPRSKSVNEPKRPMSPESTEANPVSEMTSPSRQPGAVKGRVPPPVLPKLTKPVRDRPKSMVVTSPTTENPEFGAGAKGPGSLAEKIAAVSAQLQHSVPPTAKKGSLERDLSKNMALRRTLSPQTSRSDVPEGKANGPVYAEEVSTPPPLITSAPPPPAPLPAGWTDHKTPSGHTYYYNSATGESSWTRPQPASDSSSKGQTDLLDRVAPRGWTREINPITSTPIYTNSRTGERWTLAKDGVGNYYYYNMSNPTLTVGELPESNGAPHDPMETTENLYDSLDPVEVTKSVEDSPRHNQTPSHVDLVASSLSGILKKHGYMQRKRLFDSQGKKIKSGWQKFYVALENHELSFYTDHKVRDNPSAKPLSIYCVLQSTISPYTKDKKKSVFQVSSPFGEQFLLQAETSQLMNDWYSTIQTAINRANQEFKDHPGNFKSIGDFTLDGEGGSDIHKGNAKKKLAGKANRQQSLDEVDEDIEADPMDEPEAVDRSVRIRNRLKKLMAKRPQLDQLKTKGIIEDAVFGCELHKLCEREGTNVPKFLVQFMEHIEQNGLEVVGIYRLSGNAASVTKLRYLVEQDEVIDLEDDQWADINIVSGCLKLYLRELPDPLIPFRMFRGFIEAARAPTQEKRIQKLAERVKELPVTNYCTLKALIEHLRRVVEMGHINKMMSTNCAIVFGPTIMRAEADSLEMATLMPVQNGIAEMFINEFVSIFQK